MRTLCAQKTNSIPPVISPIDQIHQLEDENSKLKSEVISAKMKIVALEGERKLHAYQRAVSLESVKTLNEQNGAMKNQINVLNQRWRLETELSEKSQQKIDKLTKDLISKRKEIGLEQHEKNRMKDQINKLTQRWRLEIALREGCQRDIDKLTKKIDQEQHEKKKMERERDQWRSDYQNMSNILLGARAYSKLILKQ